MYLFFNLYCLVLCYTTDDDTKVSKQLLLKLNFFLKMKLLNSGVRVGSTLERRIFKVSISKDMDIKNAKQQMSQLIQKADLMAKKDNKIKK